MKKQVVFLTILVVFLLTSSFIFPIINANKISSQLITSNPEWRKTFGSSGYDTGSYIIEDENNNLVIVGSKETNSDKLWVLKTNSSCWSDILRFCT